AGASLAALAPANKSLAQSNKSQDVGKTTKSRSALQSLLSWCRAGRTEQTTQFRSALTAPASNGWGLFPSVAATNKPLAESDKSGRRGNAKYSRTAREPLAAAQTKHERIPMFRTLASSCSLPGMNERTKRLRTVRSTCLPISKRANAR